MDNSELQQKIEELTQQISTLTNTVIQYKDKLDRLQGIFNIHTHSGADGSKVISSEIDLPSGTPIKLGTGGIASIGGGSKGSVAEQLALVLVAGNDQGGTVGTTTNNLQLNLLHQPQNINNQSFINAYRPPVYIPVSGSKISTTSGGTTVTIIGYNFATNSLAGALIDTYSSTGVFIETQTIASNTATVITIVGTWTSTTTNGSFLIYQPVFLGSADTVWQRLYVQEGDTAGVRFGVGPTNHGQNGTLYMDSVGDLYWRSKGAIITKLN